jgi:hypothetical protein
MDDHQKYAISEYPNVEDVYRRLDALISQPMRKITPESMQANLAYFDQKCSRSKCINGRSQAVYSWRCSA